MMIMYINCSSSPYNMSNYCLCWVSLFNIPPQYQTLTNHLFNQTCMSSFVKNLLTVVDIYAY